MDYSFFISIEGLKSIMLLLPLLFSVAYLTLAERKVLGCIQSRKGPNVIGLYGILQPLSDGIKLFAKEMIVPNHVQLSLYFFAPLLALIIALTMWGLIPLGEARVFSDLNLGLLAILALSSISIYAILISGWASNSKYAFMGALRAVAQMISYEISVGLLLMCIILCTGSLNLSLLVHMQMHTIWLILPLFPAAFMFFISCLAETNRAPFDLTEGESELVAGYNVEYAAISFALFFLGEYTHLLLMAFIFVILFLGGWGMPGWNNSIWLHIKASCIVFSFIWVRTSFPRLRYDHLMNLLWKTYLPLSLALVFMVNGTLWAFNGLPPQLCI